MIGRVLSGDRYAWGSVFAYLMGACSTAAIARWGDGSSIFYFLTLFALVTAAAWLRSALGSVGVEGSNIRGLFWGRRLLHASEISSWQIIEERPLGGPGAVLVVRPADGSLIARSPSFVQLRPGVRGGGLVAFIPEGRIESIRGQLESI
jgi:hypothetical protein